MANNNKSLTTKTMKYQIKYDKELYNLLSDIQYVVFRLKNKATSLAWDWQQFSFSYNERLGEYPKDKEKLGKVLPADIYNQIKDEFGSFVSSSTVDTAIQEAVKKFKKDVPKILRGEVSIANFKRDGAFPIRTSQIKQLSKINSKSYSCKLSLLSKEGVKEKERKSGQYEVELRTGHGSNIILDRIISGEYKMCDSQITKTKNKFYLLLTYQFESEKVKNIDENKIMGIDLGIKIPAVLAVSDDSYYRQYVGDGQEIIDFENQIISRKKRIQKSRRWAGDGSVGHGIKTRTKALEKISGKIANFKQTKNHNWSRYIVDEAVRMGCGTIQMEDLSGIATDNAFLKTWTYYQLQQYIEYKAEEKGIKFVQVKPNYTSARCSKCGHVHLFNKDKWRPEQEKFICQVCGFSINADVNGARNIAIKDIDKIIKEQIELQNKHAKHMLKYEVN